jgi:curved DNA-binding protein CbpA
VPAASHYATLGVELGASPDDVRRAYLDLARRLHPDRWIDADDRERAEADRRMREVNEAWRVLGNPARRLAYDVERREDDVRSRVSPPGPVGDGYSFSTGDLLAEDIDPPDLRTRLIRALPWILLVGTLLGVFVFSAYATAGRDGEGVRCVAVSAGVATDVDCDAAGARQVVVSVIQAGDCPPGTEPFQPAAANLALCLEVPE